MNSVVGPLGQKVLLVTLPRFSQSKMCVLVNLRTLECQPIKFDATFPASSPETSRWKRFLSTVLKMSIMSRVEFAERLEETVNFTFFLLSHFIIQNTYVSLDICIIQWNLL